MEYCLYHLPRQMYDEMMEHFRVIGEAPSCACMRCKCFQARVIVKSHVPMEEYDEDLFRLALREAVIQTGRLPFQRT